MRMLKCIIWVELLVHGFFSSTRFTGVLSSSSPEIVTEIVSETETESVANDNDNDNETSSSDDGDANNDDNDERKSVVYAQMLLKSRRENISQNKAYEDGILRLDHQIYQEEILAATTDNLLSLASMVSMGTTTDTATATATATIAMTHS